MSRYAVVTYDLLEVSDEARDRFKREMKLYGWSAEKMKTSTTLMRRFSDEHSFADCQQIAQRDLLLSCEAALLEGEVRYAITVSPNEPIVSTRVFTLKQETPE